MLTIYVDADACPVKDEVYKVARRYGMHVAIVANATLRVPADSLFELVVRPGFGAADDWIARPPATGMTHSICLDFVSLPAPQPRAERVAQFVTCPLDVEGLLVLEGPPKSHPL
jgi:Uncharacterized BCR, YaiI/YqxD family COG1671